MWRIAIWIRLLGQARLAEVILLRVTEIHREEKSVRWMLLGVLLLAAPLWISQPMNPPESHFQPSALAEWNTNRPPGALVLKTGQSLAEVEQVLGCPRGRYGNPEYVTSAYNRSPHPRDYRPLEQQLVGTTHEVWEDDTEIIDALSTWRGGC